MKPHLVVAILFLGGCASAIPPPSTPTGSLQAANPKQEAPKTAKPLTKADIETVHGIIRKKLVDPESVRFEGIEGWTTATGHVFACGWVNAKNSYGGYAGRTPFMASLSRQPPPARNLDIVGNGPFDLSLIRAACPNVAASEG